MSRVSDKLRKNDIGHEHWCPGCEDVHTIPNSWKFDGNVDCPTFSPSVKINGVKVKYDDKGDWDFVYDENGKGIRFQCHYILTKGILNYCKDCTHDMAGQSVVLPDLPCWLKKD